MIRWLISKINFGILLQSCQFNVLKVIIKKHKVQSIRFRKWSRKSYALFKSVSKHVTIGKIKNVIADRLLNKQNNLFSLSAYIFDIARKEENDDIFKNEAIQNQMLGFQNNNTHADFAFYNIKSIFLKLKTFVIFGFFIFII